MPTANQRIVKLLTKAADLSARGAELAREGKLEKALDVEREADELRGEARRIQASIAKGGKASRSTKNAEPLSSRDGAESARSLIIASLTEIGVPASPRAISEYALARFGKRIDPRGVASLRRDELRAWSSPKSARALYVVPALEGTRFLPFRGKVAISNWDLARRLIGPWSERVDHLTGTTNLARQLAWLQKAGPGVSESLLDLVASYASTITGAIAADGGLDPDQVQRAAAAELAEIGPRDKTWRSEAAERALNVLKETERLWGTQVPGLISDRIG